MILNALYLMLFSGPPSAPCNLNTSDITNTTVSLQWDDALDDGNCSDLFYTISGNISNISYDTNTTTFTLENLIPFVYYEIRVTAENGVSSQDPWVKNRSLTISVMTLEGSTYVYPSHVVWTRCMSVCISSDKKGPHIFS